MGALDDASDEKLMAAVTKGDERAFAVLVDRHSNRFLALAFRMMHERARAEDALQISFVKLWQSADRFDAGSGKFTTWFYRVVSNTCLDELRKRQFVGLPEGFDEADGREGAEDAHHRSDQQLAVEGAIAGLPERQKLIVTLVYNEDMTVAEAADVMEMNIKGAESLLHRARQKLKSLLADRKVDLI